MGFYLVPHFLLVSHFFASHFLASHFFVSFFALSHLPDWHFAAGVASFVFVHPVNDTSANPNNDERIKVFIFSSPEFIF